MVKGRHILWLGMAVAMTNLFCACALPAAPGAAAISKQTREQAEEKPRVPDEYLVTLAPDVDEAIIYEYFRRFGIKYLHDLGEETYLLIVAHDPGPRKMDMLIQNESRIRLVQPNLVHWDYR
jgi:hypothetical protein